jgi:MFS family permease
MIAGWATGIVGLCVALVITGCGLSTQHPIASAAVSRAYGAHARGPLGTYNFAGDLGKAALPSSTSLLLAAMTWHHALWIVAALGALVAAIVAVFMPTFRAAPATAGEAQPRHAGARGGFVLLLAIGMLDSAVRMGFLTFLPFLLEAKGAALSTVGFALALVFIGGAAGKFTCGWLGARFGMLATVLLTEAGTAVAILAVLALPLAPTLAVLALLGVMLNGTSSVLYGTVPELATARTERAFAIFYTGTIGSGAVAPVLYGILGDAAGPRAAIVAAAITAAAILPLSLVLAPRLPRSAAATPV